MGVSDKRDISRFLEVSAGAGRMAPPLSPGDPACGGTPGSRRAPGDPRPLLALTVQPRHDRCQRSVCGTQGAVLLGEPSRYEQVGESAPAACAPCGGGCPKGRGLTPVWLWLRGCVAVAPPRLQPSWHRPRCGCALLAVQEQQPQNPRAAPSARGTARSWPPPGISPSTRIRCVSLSPPNSPQMAAAPPNPSWGAAAWGQGDLALPPHTVPLSPSRPLASTVNDKLELQECLEHGRIAKVSPGGGHGGGSSPCQDPWVAGRGAGRGAGGGRGGVAHPGFSSILVGSSPDPPARGAPPPQPAA